MMDIYSDLDNYNEEINKEALQSENQELKGKLQEYEGKLQKLQIDFDKLEAKHKTLLENFSTLLKTARAEIERKTQTIMQINAEKDQMILRLVNNGNNREVHQLRKSNNFIQRNSIDTVDRARDSSRASPHIVRKPVKNEEKTLEPTKVPSESMIPKKEPSKDPRNIPDLRNKENQNTVPRRISSRRKSMPAFRCEEPKFSADEGEIDDQTDKHRTDTETPKSSTPSSIDCRLVESRDIERPRSSNEFNERLRSRFEERKDLKFSGRSRRSREKELIEFKERAYKRSHSGHRLESPPRYRHNKHKSRDRRSDYRAREEQERRLNEARRFGEERRKGEDKHRGVERRLVEDRRGSDEKRMSDDRHIDEERRIGEERRSNEERPQTDERHSEETRRGGEKCLNNEKRINVQRRIVEERRKSEQRRIDEERRKSEQRRIEEERRKADEERRMDEERRIDEERRRNEQRRKDEERRKAEEERRMDEERRKTEQRRIEEEKHKVDEERRRADEKRMHERRIDEERRIGEKKRIDEERRKDEEKRNSEQRRIQEERRANEERRKHDERIGVERQQRELRENRRVEEIRLCDERNLSQEKKSIDQQMKPTLHDEDRELNAKRRKLENVTEIFGRWGHSYDSPTLPFKSYTTNLPTSCQSPDEHLVDRSPMGDGIREIKLTAQSELDDPRFHCNRYVQVTDSRNKTVLASKAGLHVDLQMLKWNQVTKPEKHAEMPKDLIEPPKEMRLPDLTEQQVNDIYTSIDDNNHDVCMETSKMNGDVSEDDLFSSALTETAPKNHNNTDTKPALHKYKIPKKTTIDQDVSKAKERPLDLLYKHYKALEEIAPTQRPQDGAKTEIQSKNHSQNAALREMVEGDLALSDDDLSYDKITVNDTVLHNENNEKKQTLEPKTKRLKDKIKTRNNKTKEEKKDKTGSNNTQNKETHIEKTKDMTAKFSDLFGDSSLITPEDLNLPSEPAEAENCLLAMSENANLGGENESWSITDVPDDVVYPYSNPTGNLRTYSSKKKVEKKQKKSSPKTDSPSETRVESKISILNHAKASEPVQNPDTITLLPEAKVTNDDGVIKTVIISSGVQPQNVVEPIIIWPEIQQAAVQTESVSTQQYPVLETVQMPEVTALATSTPLRENSTENVSVSSDSNSNQNLSNSQSGSTSGTVDLKIILTKRRKRF